MNEVLSGILSKCEKLDILEKRQVDDDYIEIVFYTKDIERLSGILNEYMGEPVKPQGAKPSGPCKKISGEYGGVRKNQTMYLKKFDGFSVVVLLWPWESGEEVTVKMFFVEKEITLKKENKGWNIW